jgi:hypothetical protein
MSQFPIFKVNKLTNKNEVEIIYVFFGAMFSNVKEDINKLFKDDPTNKIFHSVFEEQELDYIKEENIDVKFIKQSIHIDDSIGIIKLKIFEAINKEASMSELYLFCLKYEKLNSVSVYENLTQNDKLPLTKVRMNQLLLNLYDDDGELVDFNLPDNPQYAFDDILKLELNEKTYFVGKPLGQKFVFSNEYPFVTNPFLVEEYDTLLENSRKELTTLNANLLLETGPIFRNTIYLCLAKDVFKVSNISSKYTSKIYYPFLFQDHIETSEQLDDRRRELVNQTNEKMTPDTTRNFNNINMFYDIFNKHKDSQAFSQNARLCGIKYLKIAIYPDFKIKIPIDVIFKLIHATHEFPLIKYNPETRQENIYRLFAPEMSADGRKIPFLQKQVIIKLMRQIGKNKSVSVYTNIPYGNGNSQLYMVCEFEDNGAITVYPLNEFDAPILLSGGDNMFTSIDDILMKTVNPLIEQIKPFFEQSGLEMPLFQSIKSVNVEIRDISYQFVYNITQKININSLSGCISSLFIIESDNLQRNGIQMRYKRVANFNKLDSQEAFIIEKIDQGYKIDEIIEELLKQFDNLNEEDATDLIVKIRGEIEVTRGANKRRALMIKINPGFKTTMMLNSITSELTVVVSGINDIYYLNTIPVFVDSVIRITQDTKSCGIKKSQITSLCSGREVKDIEFSKITSITEQSIVANSLPQLEDEVPIYLGKDDSEQGENMQELLDILGFEDGEIDEFEGGASSNGSSQSVRTESVPSDNDPMSLDGLELGSLGSFSDKISSIEVPSDKSSVELSSDKSSVELPSDKSLESVEVPSDKSLESVDVPSDKSLESVELPSDKSLESVELPSDKSLESVEVPSDKSLESVEVPSVKSSVELPSVKSSVELPSDKSLESVELPSDKSLESVKVPSDKSLESVELPSDKSLETVEVPSDKSLESVELPSDKSSVEVPSDKSSVELPSDGVKSLESVGIQSAIQKSVTPESEEIIIIPKEKKMKGKLKSTSKVFESNVRDITGMKLQYPNPFTSRLEERMPQLFVKSKNEKIDLYTRMCPFSLSQRRQPIILTKEEKDKMIAEHPNDINVNEDFIEYGTDPTDSSKKFYYTCPRYWCLLTNSMVTEKDILEGKCGPPVSNIEDAIIPKKSKVVPKGKYVYQFYDGKDNKKYYPGFHKQNTPSGLCIPCCFANWNTPQAKKRRDICQGKFQEDKNEPVDESEKLVEDKIKKMVVEMEQYVKGPEKYGPQLGEHRWGFLPVIVQKFLHEVNEDCQVSKTNAALKLNHLCILRHGVEVSGLQSFIACISSAIFYAQLDTKQDGKVPLIRRFFPNAKHNVPTIKEMKQLIVHTLNLDNFIKYQNGDLITSFADPDLEVSIENYVDTKLYDKMEKQGEQERTITRQFIIKVAQAFENFKKFLLDDTITIDYTYLWDIVCTPNQFMFEMGINLIILEIPEDDITNNIELVCPTNHYSTNVYDARKRNLILVKRENYFEPIYGYFNDGKHINITKTFSEYDKKLPKTLRAVFHKIIKPTLGEKCRAFVSRPNEYRFKQPPLLDVLIRKLIDKGYKIKVQVLNFQGKVIGVITKNKRGLEGFIPCYPSSLTTLKDKKCKKLKKRELDELEQPNEDVVCDYDFVYMNDNLWKPYVDTLEFLQEYYDEEEFMRVVEEELITGFLTNTNQFVPIKDPIPVSSVSDLIKTVSNNDTLIADLNTLTNKSLDIERVNYIKSIKLETNFYNIFRNTIRMLFNDYSNSEKRKTIKNECNKRYGLYRNQLDTVIDLLHDLVGNKIIFASHESLGYDWLDINDKDMNTCLAKTQDKCPAKGSICRIADEDNDICQLIVPKINLVTKIDNEIFYYGKMADELIRYNRITSFIFKPQAYLSFGKLSYNLRDNEIIVLQDLLNNEFFDNLVLTNINSYAKYNTYDTANPIITQAYNKEVVIDDIINPYHNTTCSKVNLKKITSLLWRKCFPDTYTEVKYIDSNNCPFNLLIDIINSFKGRTITIEEIKDTLLAIYANLTDNFKNQKILTKLIDILHEEAQLEANQLHSNVLTFERMIYNDGFIPVNFDLWVLLVHYKIPSFFISSKPIAETRFNYKAFLCYTEPDIKEYAFIVTQSMYNRSDALQHKQDDNLHGGLPIYKLILNESKEIKINIDVIEKCQGSKDISKSFENYYLVEYYLESVFSKDPTTKYKPKQKGVRKLKVKPLLIIEDDDDDEDHAIDGDNSDGNALKPLNPDKPPGNICPDYKEINPKTGRCIAKCPDGKVRDDEFKCVNPKKVFKQMTAAPEQQLKQSLVPAPEDKINYQKECPDNKEINPKTGRCIAKCPDGKVRDDEFKCVNPKKVFKQMTAAPELQLRQLLEQPIVPVPDPEPLPSLEDKIKYQKECPDNKEINPKTGRCIAKCQDGKVRDNEFRCVSKKKLTKKIGVNSKSNSPALTKTKKQAPILPMFDIEDN